MADIDKLIELNIEIDGLLRVVRDRGGEHVYAMLADKFGRMSGLMRKLLEDYGKTAGSVAGGVAGAAAAIAGATKIIAEDDVASESVRAAKTLERAAAAAMNPSEIEDDDGDGFAEVLEPVAEADAVPVLAVDDCVVPVEINERLLHAFTLNDRFRFCRELFNGNQEDFADTINVLAEMPDYAEAEEYLYNDLMWDPADANVGAFMEILSENMPA